MSISTDRLRAQALRFQHLFYNVLSLHFGSPLTILLYSSFPSPLDVILPCNNTTMAGRSSDKAHLERIVSTTCFFGSVSFPDDLKPPGALPNQTGNGRWLASVSGSEPTETRSRERRTAARRHSSWSSRSGKNSKGCVFFLACAV